MFIFGKDPNFGFSFAKQPELRPLNEHVANILKRQKYAIQIANKVRQSRNLKHKQAQDAKASNYIPVVGDIVYWKKPIITQPGVSTKLMPKYLGPCIITNVDTTNNTVLLKHLRTGKCLPSRVSIGQLKCLTGLRNVPCYYDSQLTIDNYDEENAGEIAPNELSLLQE